MESLIVIVIQYSVNKLKLRNGGQVLGKQSTQQNRKMADTDPSMWTNTKTSQGHQPCALQANGWCRRLFPIFRQTVGHPSCGPSDCPHLSGTSHTQLNTLVRCTKHCWRHCPGSQPHFSPLPLSTALLPLTMLTDLLAKDKHNKQWAHLNKHQK